MCASVLTLRDLYATADSTCRFIFPDFLEVDGKLPVREKEIPCTLFLLTILNTLQRNRIVLGSFDTATSLIKEPCLKFADEKSYMYFYIMYMYPKQHLGGPSVLACD